MDADEKFVRENWENIGVHDYGGEDKYIYLPAVAMEFTGRPESVAWAATAGYTRERLGQIRQIKEEIAVLGYMARDSRDYPSRAVAYLRILAREQAALAALKAGMRERGE